MLQQLDHIELLDQAPTAATGKPLQVPIDLIDEDPDQPRKEFDQENLQSLSESIAQRGVLQPISVRPNERPGRWIVNHGARRLRACRLAGKLEIPAFVDRQLDGFDQVAENEQRQNLSAVELAMFVDKWRRAGMSLSEIGDRLHKSSSHMTMICTLINPPDWIHTLYRSGRCRDLTDLYELRNLHKAHPDAVEQWLSTQSDLTRSAVMSLKRQLRGGEMGAPRQVQDETAMSPQTDQTVASLPSDPVSRASLVGRLCEPRQPSQPTGRSTTSLVLWGHYQGDDVTIEFHTLPKQADCLFVRLPKTGERRAVPMSDVQLLRVTLPDAHQ